MQKKTLHMLTWTLCIFQIFKAVEIITHNTKAYWCVTQTFSDLPCSQGLYFTFWRRWCWRYLHKNRFSAPCQISMSTREFVPYISSSLTIFPSFLLSFLLSLLSSCPPAFFCFLYVSCKLIFTFSYSLLSSSFSRLSAAVPIMKHLFLIRNFPALPTKPKKRLILFLSGTITP